MSEVSDARDVDGVTITEIMLLWNSWRCGERGLLPPLHLCPVKVIINLHHVPHMLTTLHQKIMWILRLLMCSLLIQPISNANKYCVTFTLS